MSDTLAHAMCERSLATGYAEVRRLIHASAVTVNGIPAEKFDQIVRQGDVIKVGKYRSAVV